MLSPYRVLDLTDDRGHLAGSVLAQLGAEVVAVEPPGGHRTRHVGPYVGDRPDPERALGHLAYRRGTASVVVSQAEELGRLAADADVVIDCGAHPPGVVDLAQLRAADPALVTVSITPFGQDGPKAAWLATDLTVAAAGGVMSITGDRDRPPVRISQPQSWLLAGLDAACAAVIALHERCGSGRGQHADVSAQQSVLSATQFQMMTALVDEPPARRLPGGVELGPFTIQFVYACRDGHVTVTFLFGPMIGPYTVRLFRWMHEEGACDDSLAEKDWISFAMDVFAGTQPISELARGTAALAAFLATRTKAELLAAALQRNLLIAPVTTTRDVLDLPQLRERGYWDVLDGVRYPGPFARSSVAPLRHLPPGASLGADTERHLGGAAARSRPRSNGPEVAAPATAASTRALDGLKVLDFMWALAGPAATRTLADHGATVVRIESQHRADVLRGVNPFLDEPGDQEGALQFHSLNAGKLGLALDLSVPQAREVALDLARWADVVTESFSPGAMARMGLGYEQLREVNPEIIMLSSCLMGQTGPMRSYAGFGTMAAAIAGFYPITGWPDRTPAGPFTAYTDYLSPRFTVAAILAALDWRRRTGQGQWIDLSQMEAALHLLTPALLDDEINGRTAGRCGNDDPHMSPHGVYPARGEDRWVAVAVEDDDQWRALCSRLGRTDLADLGPAERLDRRAELDRVVAAWTASRDASAAERELQEAGVPAHQVQGSAECVVDPQLIHRGQFRRVPHAKHGTSWVEGSPFTLSRTPPEPRWAGPTYGQHLEEVLCGLLGYDAERIADLVVAGALE